MNRDELEKLSKAELVEAYRKTVCPFEARG
jgi:hypothetical protein